MTEAEPVAHHQRMRPGAAAAMNPRHRIGVRRASPGGRVVVDIVEDTDRNMIITQSYNAVGEIDGLDAYSIDTGNVTAVTSDGENGGE